jgi:hypothetical protein
MPDIELCPECGVPRYITEELSWLDSGVIVQSRDETHRVVFIECENLGSLFKGVGEIIDKPVENIVIEGRRKGARDYVDRFIPRELKELIQNKQVDLEPIISSQMDATRVMGFGKSTLKSFQFEQGPEDHVTVQVKEPFSVLLWCASIAGASDAIVGGDWDVSYEILSPDEIEVTAFRASGSGGLREKYARKEYQHKGGDIELEKCRTCGGPMILSGFRWYLDRGVIGSAYTDRRMAINGETGMQDVFEELEMELGGGVPNAVIEAQRRFIKSGFFSIESIFSEGDFRTQFAYRGLGDLKEFMMGSTGLRLRLENSTLHLLVVGIAQALFELAFGRDSEVEWELSQESVLQVEVTPKAKSAAVKPSSLQM